MKLLADETKKGYGFVHFTHMYPLDEKALTEFFTGKKSQRHILVENNSHAQFGQLLRQQTGITFEETLLKYDGRPFWPEEIRDYVLGRKSEKLIDDGQSEDLRKDPQGQETNPTAQQPVNAHKTQDEDAESGQVGQSEEEVNILEKLKKQI